MEFFAFLIIMKETGNNFPMENQNLRFLRGSGERGHGDAISLVFWIMLLCSE